jgi:hypothetical protein
MIDGGIWLLTGASGGFCELLDFCKGICCLWLVIFAIMLMVNSGTVKHILFSFG